MTSKELVRIAEENKKCYLKELYDIIARLFRQEDSMEEEIHPYQENIAQMIDAVCKEDVEFIGEADVLHNISVEMARKGYYDYACELLKYGLTMKKYAKNKDILADYLKYSTYSTDDNFEYAAECYKRLMLIDKKQWGWRPFDFSVEYLLALSEREEESKRLLDEALKLANEYKDQMYGRTDEYADRACHCLANVYQRRGDYDHYQSILQGAVKNLRKVPMCMLELADLMYQKGNYEEAGKYVFRCARMNTGDENSVSLGYPYILSALCRIMSVYEAVDAGKMGKEEIQEQIRLIEKDFRSSKYVLETDDRRLKNLKNQIDILKEQLDLKENDSIYEE